MENHNEAEGWQVVRAKKKSSSGSGALNPRPIRPGLDGVKAGVQSVSTSYWLKQPPTAGQVHKSVFSQKKVAFSNSKSCSTAETCLLSPFEKVNLAVRNSGPKTKPFEPPFSPNPSEAGIPLSVSSAGHTPFPKGISMLARDRRIRQVGRVGRSGIPTVETLLNGPKTGPHDTIHPTVQEYVEPNDMRRPKPTMKEQNMALDMAGNSDDSEDDCLVSSDPIGGIPELAKSGRSEDQDKRSGDRVYNDFPDLNALNSPIMEPEMMENEIINGLNLNGGERNTSSKGRGVAEYTNL